MGSSFKNCFDDYVPGVDHAMVDEKECAPAREFINELKSAENELHKKLKISYEADLLLDNTVYTGSAGLALLYFYQGLKNPEESHSCYLEANKYINLSKLNKRKATFLTGDAGPLAIAAAISYKFGTERPKHVPKFQDLITQLVQLESIVQKPDAPNELLYGRAGYLYALLFVEKHTKCEVIPQTLISRVVKSIIQSGQALAKERKASVPLMWEWHNKVYLGAAHGTAGILYILLQARAYITNDDKALIKITLDGLLDLCYESGNLPSSLGSSGGDRLVQWCHGSPGLVQLCVLANELYQHQRYRSAAIKCGEVTWQRGLTSKGYSICHGVAGNAYTFLKLYQMTKDPQHLHRACCFAKWCADRKPSTERHSPDRAASLFEGIAGQLYFFRDIRDPLGAVFPGYDL